MKQDELEAKMVEQAEIEQMIGKRFEQFENGQSAADVRNKTLNLKVRAQPNQTKGGFFGMTESEGQIEQMRLDMVREFRMMRDDLKVAIGQQTQTQAQISQALLTLQQNQ